LHIAAIEETQRIGSIGTTIKITQDECEKVVLSLFLVLCESGGVLFLLTAMLPVTESKLFYGHSDVFFQRRMKAQNQRKRLPSVAAFYIILRTLELWKMTKE